MHFHLCNSHTRHRRTHVLASITASSRKSTVCEGQMILDCKKEKGMHGGNYSTVVRIYAAPPSSVLCCLLAFLAAFAAAALAFFASARATYTSSQVSVSVQRKKTRMRPTLSASSACFFSSSAFFFSSSSSALVFLGVLAPDPDLIFFLSSRASFSCCLMRLIRGSRLAWQSQNKDHVMKNID